MPYTPLTLTQTATHQFYYEKRIPISFSHSTIDNIENNSLITIKNNGIALMLYLEGVKSSFINNKFLKDLLSMFETNKELGLYQVATNVKTEESPSIENGELFKAYMYMTIFKFTHKIEYFEKSLNTIEKLYTYYKLAIQYNSAPKGYEFVSPYVNGIAGLIRIMLIANGFKENSFSQKQINFLSKVTNVTFTKTFGYSGGLAGIADTYLKIFSFSKRKEDWLAAKQKVEILIMLFHDKKSFQNLNNTFESGRQGIEYVLQSYERIVIHKETFFN